MSNRKLGLAIFALLFVAAIIGLLLLIPSYGDDSSSIVLPSESPALVRPGGTPPDAIDRVEVTPDTVQDVIYTLARPLTYSRDIRVEKFWQGGETVYDITVSTIDGITSILIQTEGFPNKNIIVTSNEYYIWYDGDSAPLVSEFTSFIAADRLADEMQMIITYEDVLNLDTQNISDAGYRGFGGEDCIFVEYTSPFFQYTTAYYVGINSGLLLGVEEYDENNSLIYRMIATQPSLDDIGETAFTLPNGSLLIGNEE